MGENINNDNPEVFHLTKAKFAEALKYAKNTKISHDPSCYCNSYIPEFLLEIYKKELKKFIN